MRGAQQKSGCLIPSITFISEKKQQLICSYSCKRRNLPHTNKCGQPQDPNEEGPQGQLWAWPGHTEQAPAQEEENNQHQHPNPDPTQLPLRPSIIGLVSVQCSQEVRN